MRVRDLIPLEAFLFGGVPERDRRRQFTAPLRDSSGGPVLEVLVINTETGELRFEPPPAAEQKELEREQH